MRVKVPRGGQAADRRLRPRRQGGAGPGRHVGAGATTGAATPAGPRSHQVGSAATTAATAGGGPARPTGAATQPPGPRAGRRALTPRRPAGRHSPTNGGQAPAHRSVEAMGRSATIGVPGVGAQRIPAPGSRAGTRTLWARSTAPRPLGSPAAWPVASRRGAARVPREAQRGLTGGSAVGVGSPAFGGKPVSSARMRARPAAGSRCVRSWLGSGGPGAGRPGAAAQTASAAWPMELRACGQSRLRPASGRC